MRENHDKANPFVRRERKGGRSLNKKAELRHLERINPSVAASLREVAA